MTSFTTTSTWAGDEVVRLPDGRILLADSVSTVVDFDILNSFGAVDQEFVNISTTSTLSGTISASVSSLGTIATGVLTGTAMTASVRLLSLSQTTFFSQTYTSTNVIEGIEVAALNDFSTVSIRSVSDGTNYDLILSRLNPLGLEVQAEVNLTASAGVDDIDPSAIVTQGGNIAVAHVRSDVSDRVEVGIYDPAGNLVGSSQVVSPAGMTAVDPEIVELTGGQLVVVWTDSAGGGVYFRVLDASGTPITGFEAAHGAGERVQSMTHDVTELSDGGFAIAWGREDDPAFGGDRIFVRTFDSAGVATSDMMDTGRNIEIGSSTAGPIVYEFRDGVIVAGDSTSARAFGDGTVGADFVQLTSSGTAHLGGGIDFFIGSSGDDTVFGGGASDHITGGDGDDFISGGASDPGGSFGNGQQVLNGEGGNDHIVTSGSSFIDGGDDDDLISGSSMNDTIYGGSGNDIIRGRGGDDIIEGGLGNDRIILGDGDSTVDGGNGRDFIRANGGAGSSVEVAAGASADTVLGSDGDDLILGEAGNDSIDGRGGDDTLVGGPGADAFVYTFEFINTDGLGNRTEGGVGDDVILDFTDGTDLLRIDQTLVPNFGELVINTVGGNVEIDFGDQGSLVLMNMGGLFDSSDVVFF